MKPLARNLTRAAFAVLVTSVGCDTRAANDSYVAAFDRTHFTAPVPTDSLSATLRALLVNSNEYALGNWYTAKYGAQGAVTYLDLWNVGTPSNCSTECVIRAPASQAYALAISLVTDAYDPSVTGQTAAQAKTIALRLIRSIARSHVANGVSGNQWPITELDRWQSAYWAALAGTAGWLLWNDLGSVDREYVRKMVESEANRFIGLQVEYWRDREGTLLSCGNTKAESNAWDARLLFLAPVMLAQHSRRSGWSYKANELSIGAFARPTDVDDDTTDLRGRKVTDWLEGTNVNDDGTLVNHSMYHPDYVATVTESISGALVHALAGRSVPLNALWNVDLEYWSLAERAWVPSLEVLPCPASPPFEDPSANNPGGTMYVPGYFTAPTGVCSTATPSQYTEVYYPQGGDDWGPWRRMHFAGLDVMVDAFMLDDWVEVPAVDWANWHATAALSMQARRTDGASYVCSDEDTYHGREEWAAREAAQGWLARWLDAQGALITTNSVEQIVIDDGDRGVSIQGTWTKGSPASNGVGVFGPSVRYKTAGTGTAWVKFEPRMSQTRQYDVYAWWHDWPNHATNAEFIIDHASGTSTVTKDQRVNGNKWVKLGTYSMGPGDHVKVTDNANGYVVADGILLHPI